MIRVYRASHVRIATTTESTMPSPKPLSLFFFVFVFVWQKGGRDEGIESRDRLASKEDAIFTALLQPLFFFFYPYLMAKDRARIPDPTVQFRILKDTITCGIRERRRVSDEQCVLI